MLSPYLTTIEYPTETDDMVRPVILLVAYACTPEGGAEAHAGWERVVQAARDFEVHVIVSAESFAALESYRQPHAMPGVVHFHTPKEDALYRLLLRLPNLHPGSSIAYHYWQHLAYDLARELHRRFCFSLVHQVNLGTFREPGMTWRLGIPYVWGPVGCTENMPKSFLTGLPLAEQMKERIRTLSNRLFLRRRRVRSAGRRASSLLATNSTTRSDFERAFRRPIELLPATALDCVQRPETAKFRAPGPLNILWSGAFETSMGLPLLLEALANIGFDVDYQLRILGAGALEQQWKALAVSLGIARRCTFLGEAAALNTQRPGGPAPGSAQAMEQLEWAHLFVHTGLRETPGSMVLEALGQGVPVMCFDHQSAGDLVTAACGIKIPVTHPGHAIAAMASSVRALTQDRSRLLQLSAGACDRARNYLWSENGARVTAIYRSLVLAGLRR